MNSSSDVININESQQQQHQQKKILKQKKQEKKDYQSIDKQNSPCFKMPIPNEQSISELYSVKNLEKELKQVVDDSKKNIFNKLNNFENIKKNSQYNQNNQNLRSTHKLQNNGSFIYIFSYKIINIQIHLLIETTPIVLQIQEPVEPIY